jgi:hypothetical protein
MVGPARAIVERGITGMHAAPNGDSELVDEAHAKGWGMFSPITAFRA